MELLDGMKQNCGEGNVSWYPERQFTIFDLVTQVKPKNIIEIGFNEGHSAKIICDAICELKKQDEEYFKLPISFFVFDICKYQCTFDNFEIMSSFYKQWNIHMNLVPGPSEETVPLTLKNFGENFDFIEIDGCHLYDCVKTDIKNVINRVSTNGIIYLDDYSSTKDPTPDVDKAVTETDWEFFNTYHIDGAFWGQRQPYAVYTMDDILKQFEQVDHPSHYGGEENPYEAIKVIDAWNLGFSLGNTVKYISRAGKKDPQKELEDLKKAMWYLQHHISKLEINL
jgi:hypothetical protein